MTHKELPVDLNDLSRSALIRMINHLMKGERQPGDADRAMKEAKDKADLHAEKHGRPNRIPVKDDDVPFEIDDAHAPDDTPDDEESPSEKSGTDEDSEASDDRHGKRPFPFQKKK